MIYAPIIIPTLNRINHLKRCIKSLSNNPWSRYTELYISVDYPPSEKYYDGYQDVLAFVDELSNNSGSFSKVVVYKQTENLGVLENQFFLVDRLRELGFDRYIFTEDDNEFSPIFIEFMDKGLEYFINDEKVLAICSQSVPFIDFDSNYFYSPWVSVWGIGYWMDRRDAMDSTLSWEYFDGIVKSRKKRKRLLKMSPAIYRFFASNLIDEFPALRNKQGEITSVDIA